MNSCRITAALGRRIAVYQMKAMPCMTADQGDPCPLWVENGQSALDGKRSVRFKARPKKYGHCTLPLSGKDLIDERSRRSCLITAEPSRRSETALRIDRGHLRLCEWLGAVHDPVRVEPVDDIAGKAK
jgi:hypothetical protein